MKLPEGFTPARWGGARDMCCRDLDDGTKTLTKEILVTAGGSMSYQLHRLRDEIWTFAGGEGRVVYQGEERTVRAGDVLILRRGELHSVKAVTDLYFVEVQIGEVLSEEDIERYEWTWAGA